TAPVLVNCLGAPTAPTRLQVPDGRQLPVYPFPETAIRALSRAVEYAEWRDRPQGMVPDLDGVDEQGARAIVDEYVADQPDGGWPSPQTAALLLAAVGITVLPVV